MEVMSKLPENLEDFKPADSNVWCKVLVAGVVASGSAAALHFLEDGSVLKVQKLLETPGDSADSDNWWRGSVTPQQAELRIRYVLVARRTWMFPTYVADEDIEAWVERGKPISEHPDSVEVVEMVAVSRFRQIFWAFTLSATRSMLGGITINTVEKIEEKAEVIPDLCAAPTDHNEFAVSVKL